MATSKAFGQDIKPAGARLNDYSSPTSIPQTDGAMESNQHIRLGGDQIAIFVHAGAGVHSFEHEKDHLAACSNAAKSGMSLMLNGATAVDACEMGVRTMEDCPITNCGFGSNPNFDGDVECDASIVDHFGRSGAVGALQGVKNPIHVAREILEQTKQRLSFGRVPANLLTGDGALRFAEDHGIYTCHPICLVAPAAGRKHAEWKSQVDKVDEQEDDEEDEVSSLAVDSVQENVDPDYPAPDNVSLWNEGQPQTPRIRGSDFGDAMTPVSLKVQTKIPWESKGGRVPQHGDVAERDSFNGNFTHKSKDDDFSKHYFDTAFGWSHDTEPNEFCPFGESAPPFPGLVESDPFNIVSNQESPNTVRLEVTSAPASESCTREDDEIPTEDIITDTVGVIAVDSYGNIAAASSSGGTGLKHKGRVGPAALINIGTAVIPADNDDDEEDPVSVACVTSGTGEHIATTMAAGLCAERIYTSTRRGKGGRLDATDEETALRAWIEKEFSCHPSVRSTPVRGAIGVLAVKKTPDAIYLHFGHTTDSFAIAYMGADDAEPKCVMSRNFSKPNVVTGGGVVRYDPTNVSKPKKKSEALKTLKKRRVLRQKRDLSTKQVSPKMKAGDMEADLTAETMPEAVPKALELQFRSDENQAVNNGPAKPKYAGKRDFSSFQMKNNGPNGE